MSARFHWGLRGLDEAKFRAYSDLLRLRHNGQVQAPFSPARDWNDTKGASTENDDDSEANTIVVEELVSFDETRLKETFQDRLAELISTEKGGYHVAATVLAEQDGQAKLLVAKNRKFKQRDRDFLHILASTLREIANDGDTNERLWQELISYYEPRLQDQISELRQCFKALDSIFCDDLTVENEERSKFALMVLGFREVVMGSLDLSANARLDLLTRMSHDIRTSYTEQEFTDEFSRWSKKAKRLYLALCFLGRLRAAYYVIIRAAERLPSFRDLSISLVALGHNQDGDETGSSENKSARKLSSWTLAQTFESLRVPFDDQHIRLLIGQIWSRGTASARFSQNQAQIRQTHVEIQLLAYAVQNGFDERSTTGYIGCSKRSCFLCWTFLQAHGGFRSRGCHGKCYNIWRLPEIHYLSEESVTRLKRAVISVQIEMVKIITSPPELPLLQAKESTIGGSSLATRIRLPKDTRIQDLAIDHIQRQREDQMIREFAKLSSSPTRPLSIEDFTEPGSITDFNQLSLENNGTNFSNDPKFDQSGGAPVPLKKPRSPSGSCDKCCDKTARRCSYCGDGFFCNLDCEERMPLRHLYRCNVRAVTTADILYDAALKDLIPDDPQTLEDYGFANCQNRMQQSHLFGLYQGLLKFIEVRRETLHEWKTQGTLVENIIEKYEEWPIETRGGFFSWFLKHTDLLDGSTRPSRTPEEEVNEMIEEAKLQLSPEERTLALWDLKPLTKQFSFLTYSIFIQSSHPPPYFKAVERFPWFEFGFCVCRDEHEERDIGRLYSKLTSGNKHREKYNESLGGTYLPVPKRSHCTFEEFWQAYARGKLVPLMDKYKLRKDRQLIRHLDTFLSNSLNRPRPSVWNLKHLLACDDLNVPREIMAPAIDYGFSWTMSLTLRSKLTNFYRELFGKQKHLLEFGPPGVDPLEVHEARQKGTLLEYARSFLEVDPDVATIVRNLPRP